MAAVAAFSMEVKMLEARVLRCRWTLKNPRWSKFPEPSTTASLIIILWFWDVKGTLKRNNDVVYIDKLHSENSAICFTFTIISSLLVEKIKVEVLFLNLAPLSACVTSEIPNVFCVFSQHWLDEIF
uniref:Uncharacterized protein n=1 Tax=Rhipicephalus zambeziensis TaxID=60191 RepID=A0A224YT63_9ACAR